MPSEGGKSANSYICKCDIRSKISLGCAYLYICLDQGAALARFDGKYSFAILH
jgi:hypothetical protein